MYLEIIVSNGKVNRYGLGVGIKLDKNKKVVAISHDGANVGYSSLFRFNISNGSGFVLLTNAHFANLSQIDALLRKNIVED